jgi:PPP family 3-phenylpropionic acid transporter
MGALLLTTPVDGVIVWVVFASLGFAATAILALPAEPVADGAPVLGRARFRGLGRLLRDPVFLTTIFAVGAVQAAHAFQYGFSAILWKAQGISEAVTGQLWAFGVIVEIALMWVFEPWRRRIGIGPWSLLMVGCAAAVLRWSVMALAPPLWLLWPLQALHALTFSAGVLIGLATAVSGPLYDRFGAGGYWAMAALAAAGLLAAIPLRGQLARERGRGDK